jgi:hypothetical protein
MNRFFVWYMLGMLCLASATPAIASNNTNPGGNIKGAALLKFPPWILALFGRPHQKSNTPVNNGDFKPLKRCSTNIGPKVLAALVRKQEI